MTPSAASDAEAPDIAAGWESSRFSKSAIKCVPSSPPVPISNAIDRAAINAGMTTMVDDGVAKCRAGITSAAELLRVTTIR